MHSGGECHLGSYEKYLETEIRSRSSPQGRELHNSSTTETKYLPVMFASLTSERDGMCNRAPPEDLSTAGASDRRSLSHNTLLWTWTFMNGFLIQLMGLHSVPCTWKGACPYKPNLAFCKILRRVARSVPFLPHFPSIFCCGDKLIVLIDQRQLLMS